MRTILDKLREVGLKVKPSKCVLFKTEIQYLGHVVSAAGVNTMPDKIQALKDWPTPNCITDVRAFLGLASYYRKFVKGFATIAEPLTALNKKMVRFSWTPQAQDAFELISALQHFRHYLIGNKVILRTDHYSLKWLKTFKIPEGILARWIETLAEFDIEIEHRPGLAHSNVDGVSRPFCKQCEGKVSKTNSSEQMNLLSL